MNIENKKICFIISPIGERESEIRRRSDNVMNYIIVPAVKEKGYEVVRADGIAEPGTITSQIYQYLLDADLVVADLSGANPNVYYELGIRYGINRPVILVVEQEEKLPFDIGSQRIIKLNHRDLRSADEAKRQIVKHVEAAEGAQGRDGRRAIHSPFMAAISDFRKVEDVLISLSFEKQAAKRDRAATEAEVPQESDLVMTERFAEKLESLMSSTVCWQVIDGKASRIEFRRAVGMFHKSWAEPSLSFGDAKSDEPSRWPGHKRAQISAKVRDELGIDWPGVVYRVTPELLVASKIVQEYALSVYHIARCLHAGAISRFSVGYLWRYVDLAFPANLVVDEDLSDDSPRGEFWRWVEFLVFGNHANQRLSRVGKEKRDPWILMHNAVKSGPYRIGHQ